MQSLYISCCFFSSKQATCENNRFAAFHIVIILRVTQEISQDKNQSSLFFIYRVAQKECNNFDS